MSACTDFQKQIYALVQEIPSRQDHDLRKVAARAGRPRAARAVGRAMATNPFAILVPCHRVVAKGGLGGYLWGIEMKEKLSVLKGIEYGTILQAAWHSHGGRVSHAFSAECVAWLRFMVSSPMFMM